MRGRIMSGGVRVGKFDRSMMSILIVIPMKGIALICSSMKFSGLVYRARSLI